MTLVLVTAVTGGLGAVARFVLDTTLARRFAESWVRLMVVNVSGSLLLGLLVGLAAQQVVGTETRMVLGAGFLGGYTTFSAASVATVQLAEQRRWPSALLASAGMLLASAAAATLGLLIGGSA